MKPIMEHRSYERVPFITRGKGAAISSTDSGKVYTANISRHGLCFLSLKSMPVEAELLLELELGDSEESMAMEHVHGCIRWKRDWGELSVHGFQFSSPLSIQKTPRLLQNPMVSRVFLQERELTGQKRGRSKDPLTGREREVTRLIAKGYNNREMAQRLLISTKTVETHRANIYSKLKVHNAVQLLRALEKSGRWLVNQG